MAVKNLIQDVIPKEGGRSIRNIQLNRTRAKTVAMPPKEMPNPEEQEYRKKIKELKDVKKEFMQIPVITSPISPDPIEPLEHTAPGEPRPPKAFKPKKWFVIGGAVIVIIAGFLITNFFHSAKIEVEPKTVNVSIKTDVTANLTSGAQDLPYKTLNFMKEEDVVVKSTGEKQVDKRASGTIVIYNNYTTVTQRLIKNTRFATPEGLIFRIDQSIAVPGKKGTIPGSIEAVVYADEIGEKYNVGLKDFVIPGFKGDPRYTAFYARSKPSSPIQGGFSGIMKVVSEADRKSAEANLKKNLTENLLKEVTQNVPAGYVYYTNLYKINWAPITQENLDANQVRIKQSGTIYGVIIERNALATYLALGYFKEYKNEGIEIENIDELAFAPNLLAFNPDTDKTISVTISGEAKFVWIFDEVALKQSLIGKTKSEFYELLKNYPMISSANATFYPFWKTSFPDSFTKITIEKK